MNPMKRCSKCNEIKPLSEFRTKKGKDPVLSSFSICKNCQIEIKRNKKAEGESHKPVSPKVRLKQFIRKSLEEGSEAEKMFAAVLDELHIPFEYSYPVSSAARLYVLNFLLPTNDASKGLDVEIVPSTCPIQTIEEEMQRDNILLRELKYRVRRFTYSQVNDALDSVLGELKSCKVCQIR